jgi:hypothetical protein
MARRASGPKGKLRSVSGGGRKKAPRFKSDFNLGGEQAEADPLLDEAFVEWAGYSAVESRRNARCFFVGRTGSGKSAVLQRIEEVHPEHVVRINPEDLSLPYIIDLGVIRHLASLNVHLDPLFIALWKHVLLVEIIKHRYKVDSPAKKRNVLEALRETVRRDSSKQAALEYLDEFGESFWCDTHERVREITTNFEHKVEKVAGVDFGGAQLGIGGIESGGTSVRSEQVDTYQRLVNETQLPRLNKMIAVLNDEILSSSQHFTYVVVDDLDRDWVDEQVANDLIRCLFRAVLDLQKVENLKIVVALRTNIFDYLNFGSRTGGQEEKFRALQFRINWTREELVRMADERARVAAEHAGLPDVASVAEFLPRANKTHGNPTDYIFERTLMRPRDVIAFLNECLMWGTGKSRLAWADIYAAEAAYSHNRLLALRDEWKTNYPGIDKVLEVFRGAPSDMSRNELTKYLNSVALLTAEQAFDGVRWLTEIAEPVWNGGAAPEEWGDSYQPLVKLLYDLGFLGIGDGRAPRFSYEHPSYADAPNNLGPNLRYVVHPAFRATLGVRRRSERAAATDSD